VASIKVLLEKGFSRVSLPKKQRVDRARSEPVGEAAADNFLAIRE
jgi:hypothetical protein